MKTKTTMLVLIFCMISIVAVFVSRAIADESGPAKSALTDQGDTVNALEWKARYYGALITNLEYVYRIKMFQSERYLVLAAELAKTNAELNQIAASRVEKDRPKAKTQIKEKEINR